MLRELYGRGFSSHMWFRLETLGFSHRSVTECVGIDITSIQRTPSGRRLQPALGLRAKGPIIDTSAVTAHRALGDVGRGRTVRSCSPCSDCHWESVASCALEGGLCSEVTLQVSC